MTRNSARLPLRILCAMAWMFAVFATPAASAAPTPQAQREIDALIAALGASDCRFERNGDWHDATAAKAHLQKKYDYLRKREMADTAELFIERAASRSSLSGKPYRVRCGRDAAVESAMWFKRKLAEIRAAGR